MSELNAAVQGQLEDLKKRVAELERAEIQLRIQSVGPRGPIGPSGPVGQQGERGATGTTGVQGGAGRDGVNGRDGANGRTPGKDELESMVVTLLNEYHVLDPESGLPYAGPYAVKK